MTLLGVDIGTTGCKAAVVSAQGAPLATAYREYPLITPRPGWAQLDPDEVWDAACSAIREVTSADVASPRAVAVATLGEAVTPIDSRGRALGPSIVSFDRRAADCHQRIVERAGRDSIERITGLAPMPHYTAAKWSWLAAEVPDVYRAAARLVCYGDLVAARLGLEPMIDHTMATRTLAFDRHSRSWSDEILDAAGVDRAKLPAPVPSGTIVGTIGAEHCRDLGLAPGAVLVAGGLDQACAAHALGIGGAGPGGAAPGGAAPGGAGPGGAAPGSAGPGGAGPGGAGPGGAGPGGAGPGGAGSGGDAVGPVLLSLGTVAVLAMVLDAERPRPLAVPTGPHVVEGRSLSVAGAPAGGAVLRWYRDVLGAADVERAEAAGADFYDTVVSAAAAVETTSIVVPHFAGSRAAFADPDSLGVMAGLTFGTDRRHLVRALLEGVALETAVMAGRLAAAVAPVTAPRARAGRHASPADTGEAVGSVAVVGAARERSEQEREAPPLDAPRSHAAAWPLRAVGGGSKSGPWMQIFADVLGVPVESAASSYGAAAGAALIAGSAIDAVEGNASMPMAARFEPDPGRAEHYRAKLVLYRRLYETMAAVRRDQPEGVPGSTGST